MTSSLALSATVKRVALTMLIVGAAVLGGSGTAAAIPTGIGGQVNLTNASPSFNRPDEACSSGEQRVVSYTTVEFYTDADGSYTFETSGNMGVIGHVDDPYLFIYESPFDPSMEFTNCVAGNDDITLFSNRESRLTLPLTTGNIYTAIITTWDAGQTGLINWAASGAGTLHYVISVQSASTSDATTTGGTLTVQLSDADDAYWVAVPQGAPTPSSLQIIAGHNSTDTAATAAGHFTVATGGTDTTTPITGLTAATTYDVYVVAYNGGAGSGVRNTSLTTTSLPVPTLVSSTPADNATDVALDSTIVLTFSADISLDSGNITIVNDTDTTQEIIDTENPGGKLAIDGTNKILTITPSALLPGKSYHIEVASTALFGANGHYAGISNATALNFSTVAADTTPEAFSFTPVLFAPPGTTQISNALEVSGINSPAAISITGGKYAINGDDPTDQAGTVKNGDLVVVTQTASPLYRTLTTASLTVGGVTAPFDVTTGYDYPLIESSTFTGQRGNCTDGGVRIIIGIDYNADGMLDETEEDRRYDVCNGTPGANGENGTPGSNGSNGEDGAPGSNGSNGTNGTNGKTALIGTKPLSADPEVCPNGGVLIQVGLDDDNNGMLDDSEIKSTRAVCHGLTTVSQTVTLDAKSADCPYGGIKVQLGVDADGNGQLDAGEVTSSETLCNGVSLAQRSTKLDAGSEDCPAGGVRYEAGLDGDGDLMLGDSEVTSNELICNSIGVLFDVKTLAEDPKVCAHGGLQILIGRDDGQPSGTAGDAVLQPDEVDTTRNVCLAATDVLIGGGDSSCSVSGVGQQSRSGHALATLTLLGASLMLRRRRQRSAR